MTNADLNIIVKLKDLASQGWNSMTASFIKGQLALDGVRMAAQAAGDAIREGLELATQLESASLAFATLSGSAEEYNKIQSLIADNSGDLFTEVEIANAMKYAQAAGVAVDTMEQLMPALKNSAVLFGEDLQTAVTAVTRAMKFGEAELAERIGLQLREYAVMEQSEKMYGKRLGQLTQEQKEQVILQAVLDQTANRMGLVEDASDSAAVAKQRLSTANTELSTIIGNLFLPVWTQFQNSLAGFVTGVGAWIEARFKSITAAIMVTYSWLSIVGQGISAVFKSIFAGLVSDVSIIEIWNKAMGNVGQTLTNLDEMLESLYTTTIPEFGEAGVNAMKDIGSSSNAVEKTLQSLEERLMETVINHREKSESIKEQLKDEKKAFKETYSDITAEIDKELSKGEMILGYWNAQTNHERVEALKEQLKDAEEAHDEKVSDLENELQKEMKLQKKYGKLFAKYKDSEAKDDIMKLLEQIETQEDIISTGTGGMIQTVQQIINSAKSNIPSVPQLIAGSGDTGGEKVFGGLLGMIIEKFGQIINFIKKDAPKIARAFRDTWDGVKLIFSESLDELKKAMDSSPFWQGFWLKINDVVGWLNWLRDTVKAAVQDVFNFLYTKLTKVPFFEDLFLLIEDATKGISELKREMQGMTIPQKFFNISGLAPLADMIADKLRRLNPFGGSPANDFIARPGQPMQKFSSQDTVVGFKSLDGLRNMVGGGGVTVNIYNPSVRSDRDIYEITRQIKGVLGREAELLTLGAR